MPQGTLLDELKARAAVPNAATSQESGGLLAELKARAAIKQPSNTEVAQPQLVTGANTQPVQGGSSNGLLPGQPPMQRGQFTPGGPFFDVGPPSKGQVEAARGPTLGESGKGFAAGIGQGFTDMGASLVDVSSLLYRGVGLKDQAKQAHDYAQGMRQFWHEKIMAPKKAEGGFPEQVGQGFGTSFAFGPAATFGAIGTGLAGAAQGFAESYYRAKGSGLSDGKALTEGLYGALGGSTEAFSPASNVLTKLDQATHGGIKKMLLQSLLEGGEEALQEFLQSGTSDVAHAALTGEDVKVLDNALQSGKAAFGSGLLMSILGATPGLVQETLAKKADHIREVTKKVEPGAPNIAPPLSEQVPQANIAPIEQPAAPMPQMSNALGGVPSTPEATQTLPSVAAQPAPLLAAESKSPLSTGLPQPSPAVPTTTVPAAGSVVETAGVPPEDSRSRVLPAAISPSVPVAEEAAASPPAPPPEPAKPIRTKFQAQQAAEKLFGERRGKIAKTPGGNPDSTAYAPFVVYEELPGFARSDGSVTSPQPGIVARGRTWDAAFAEARRQLAAREAPAPPQQVPATTWKKGDLGFVTVPTLNGPKDALGHVEFVRPDGLVDVRVSERGTFKVKPDEIKPYTPAPEQPVASMPTEPGLFGKQEKQAKSVEKGVTPKTTQGMLIEGTKEIPGQSSILDAAEQAAHEQGKAALAPKEKPKLTPAERIKQRKIGAQEGGGSLEELIRANGGLSADQNLGREISDRFSNKESGRKSGFLGPLVRAPGKGGMDYESARELAHQHGFISDPNMEFNDFMDAIEANQSPASLEAQAKAHDAAQAEEGARLAEEQQDAEIERLAKADAPRRVAYHGTPHDFETFDSSKIGSGEGAQSFGHGLYFTDKKEIAQHYQSKLSSPTRTLTERAKDAYQEGDSTEEAEAAFMEQPMSGSERQLVVALKEFGWLGFDFPHEAVRAALGKDLDNFDPSPEVRAAVATLKAEPRGNIHAVELSPAEDEYLLWDRPLSEQSEKVLRALDKSGLYPGAAALEYKRISEKMDEMAGRPAAEHAKHPEWRDQWDAMQSERMAILKEHPEFRMRARDDGAELYRNIANSLGVKASQQRIAGERSSEYTDPERLGSNALHAAGIRGIKYLDNTARLTSGGELIRVWEEDGGWKARIRVTDRANGFTTPGTSFTTSKPYATEAEARAWADEKIGGESYNYVIFSDKDVRTIARASTLDELERELIEKLGKEGKAAIDDLGRYSETVPFSTAPLDHEFIKKAANIARIYAKRGYYQFKVFARDMEQRFGEKVRPYLSKAWSIAKNELPPQHSKWMDSPPVGPGETAISEAGGFDVPSEGMLDQFARLFQDKFRRIKTVQGAVQKQGGAVGEESNVYRAEELMTGRAAATLRRFDVKHKRPLLKLIKSNGIKPEDVGSYLYARHAPKRNAVMAERHPQSFTDVPGSGMSDEEAARLVAKYESGPQGDVFKKIAEHTDAINEDALDLRVQAGLLSEDEAQGWRDTFGPTYAPLRTDAEENVRTGRGYSIKGKEAKRAEGRISKADNPLYFIVSQYEEAAVRAEKNRVGQAFLKFVTDNPDPSLWSTEKGEPIPEGTVRAENSFSVKVNGVEQVINIRDPLLARALKNLGEQKVGLLVRALSTANRTLSKLNTSYDPEFIVGNLARDVQTAGLNMTAEQGVGFAARSIAHIPEAVAGTARVLFPEAAGKDAESGGGKYAEAFREARDAGGLVGWYSAHDFQAAQKEFESMLGKSAPRRIAEGFFDMVDAANGTVETATRLSAFVEAKKSGMTTEQAASLMKNLTVNFNRRGEWGLVANSLYLFANAGIQGSARVVSSLRRNPRMRALVLGVATSGALLDALNRSLSGDDDDGENYYDKIAEWEKERNLILMRPGTKGLYYKIPMPYGFAAFSSLGRNAAAAGFGATPPTKALSNSMVAFWDNFNPVGGEADLAQMVSPTLADPFVQHAENKTFYGGPIKPDQPSFQPKVPESELFWKSTPEGYKSFARWLNKATGGSRFDSGAVDVSPEVVEHYADFVAGGAGRTLKRFGEWIASKEDQPISRVPFLRRFMGEPDPRYVQQKFYSNLEEVERRVGEVKLLRKEGQLREAIDVQQKYAQVIGLASRAKDVRERVSELKKKDGTAALVDSLMKSFNREVIRAGEVRSPSLVPAVGK